MVKQAYKLCIDLLLFLKYKGDTFLLTNDNLKNSSSHTNLSVN